MLLLLSCPSFCATVAEPGTTSIGLSVLSSSFSPSVDFSTLSLGSSPSKRLMFCTRTWLDAAPSKEHSHARYHLDNLLLVLAHVLNVDRLQAVLLDLFIQRLVGRGNLRQEVLDPCQYYVSTHQHSGVRKGSVTRSWRQRHWYRKIILYFVEIWECFCRSCCSP